MFLCFFVSGASAWSAPPVSFARPEVPAKTALDFQEGKAFFDNKKWSESIVLFRKALKTAPQWTLASLYLAKALVYAGRRAEALGVLEQSIQRERGETRAKLIQQLRVFSRLFLTQEAAQVFQEGLSWLRQKKVRLARERFFKTLEMEPDHFEAILRIGQTLVLEQDADSAVERFYLARKLNPHEPEVNLWLGRTFFLRGEQKQALQELSFARQALNESELAALWYSEALVSAGQRSSALRFLEKNATENPFHLRALLSLSVLKYQSFNKSNAHLWSIRKDLQLVLSRLETYSSAKQPRFESELGLEFKESDEIKTEAQTLLSRISSKLEAER